jgi:hypothetical protein
MPGSRHPPAAVSRAVAGWHRKKNAPATTLTTKPLSLPFVFRPSVRSASKKTARHGGGITARKLQDFAIGGGGGGSIIDSSAIIVLAEVSGVASPDGSPNGEIIITEIPEPTPLALAGLSGLSLLLFRRQRKYVNLFSKAPLRETGAFFCFSPLVGIFYQMNIGELPCFVRRSCQFIQRQIERLFAGGNVVFPSSNRCAGRSFAASIAGDFRGIVQPIAIREQCRTLMLTYKKYFVL